MAVTYALVLAFLFTFSHVTAHATQHTAETNNLKNYIVHVTKPEGRLLADSEDLQSWHRSFLPVSVASSGTEQRMLYSYQSVLSGFAARLTEKEAKAMEGKDGFVSARPERILCLQTTHTPTFLGLRQGTGLWKQSNFGKGVVIGVLDGGILPDHPSFRDEGMPPPPAK